MTPRFFDSTVQTRQRVATIGSRRSSHDGEHDVSTAVSKFNEGLERQVNALQCLESTDEEQHRVFTLDAQRPAGLRAIARREEGVLDTQGHDVHPRWIRVVEADELLGLDLTTCEHRVGAGEDRRLLKRAILRFALERLGLHAFEAYGRS